MESQFGSGLDRWRASIVMGWYRDGLDRKVTSGSAGCTYMARASPTDTGLYIGLPKDPFKPVLMANRVCDSGPSTTTMADAPMYPQPQSLRLCDHRWCR